MRLKGKSAIVTGAASGIGRATAIAMAREGAAVLLTDIDDAGGHETLATIAKAGGRAAYAHQDVVDEAVWQDIVAQAVRLHGHLDTLVNNAGIGAGHLVTEMSLEAWNRQVAINLTGPFLGIKHSIPAMRAHIKAGGTGGSIINISSVAGLEGAPGLAGYCATKGGIRLFTKAVAKEYAADRIRCNSVHPGIIDTPIWTSIDAGGLQATREALGTPPGANSIPVDAIALVGTPLGRAGQPEEVAAGIVFLASDESGFMTGSELVIDGGWTA
jgi:NAD(P)-dependent dehydrogenase (short-subunit alcohol dehydrogenase family)